jgi:hypothetical protein
VIFGIAFLKYGKNLFHFDFELHMFLIALGALVLTWIYSFKTSQSTEETLSLQAFERALKEFADEEARKNRNYIKNLPDYTKKYYYRKEEETENDIEKKNHFLENFQKRKQRN